MTALNLECYALDGSKFTTNHTTRVMVTEASDVGFTECHRLYDDACDEGICIRGRRKTLTFYLKEVRKDSSGEDVLAWVFAPTPETRRRESLVADYTVHILND